MNFTYCHLAVLQIGQLDSKIVEAIRILSRQNKVCSVIQQEFDQDCLEATSRINCDEISIASPSLASDTGMQNHVIILCPVFIFFIFIF